MCTNSQDELVYVLKCTPTEENESEPGLNIPRQIIFHIMDIYDKSLHGARILSMQHVIYDFEASVLAKRMFEETNSHEDDDERDDANRAAAQNTNRCLLGNKDNAGFLYFRPTRFHSKILDEFLTDRQDSFLIGLLLQKWEIPWAKLFPLRLYLRLGEQFDCKSFKINFFRARLFTPFVVYPCPLVSDRTRKPVYGEIGHTIMSLLCDTRNFQYTIPQIDGLSIRMDELQTHITIPESQYDFIVKSLLTSNDYVFSLALLQVDEACGSYLVATENENLGSYSSKTVSYTGDDSDEFVNKKRKY